VGAHDGRLVADGDVGQRGVGADPAARPDAGIAEQLCARLKSRCPAMVTLTSIQVVAGSTTVTPAR